MQGAAKVVVVDDEELHQHRIPCLFNSGEDCIEGCFAVDEQPYLIIRQARHPAQPGHGPQRAIGFGVACRQGFVDPGSPVEVSHGHMHFAVGLAPGLNVGVECATAEYQVRDQGEVRDKEQRQGPGDCPLGSAHGEHRMRSGDSPE
ncbi:hypothetical protein D3C79_698480 [compost metagenome]